jgi:hypothetical protein
MAGCRNSTDAAADRVRVRVVRPLRRQQLALRGEHAEDDEPITPIATSAMRQPNAVPRPKLTIGASAVAEVAAYAVDR